MGRVLVIGLDGATFDLIDPWVEEGKLPVLAECIKGGTRSNLLSTPLSNSAQAWSSFITGKNPGKHGIYDFFETREDSYGVRFLNASYRKGKSLWRLISDADKKVGVMNVPMTYPAEAVNGVFLSGLDSPGIDSNFAYPKGLMEEIYKNVGGYILEPGIWGYIRRGRPDIALQKLLEMVKIRTSTARYLMKSRDWDLFMVVYTATDKVQHHFWKYIDPTRPEYQSNLPYSNAILQVYQEIDKSIQILLENAVDASVIIMSDHGAGPSTRRTMYINRWLNKEGFLHYKDSDKVSSRLGQIKYSLLEQTSNEIKKLLPRKTKEFIIRMFPGIRDKADSVLLLPGIDWSKTKAYSRENHPAIFINTEGREFIGIVKPGKEYEEVRDEIIGRLKNLHCPETGLPIVGEVFKREDIYHGPEAFKAPDIVFQWNRFLYVHRPSKMGKNKDFLEILDERSLLSSENTIRPSGIHRDNGIFIAYGKHFERNKVIEGAQIYDIAPTVLYLLGIPIPDDMDGRVIEDAFNKEYLKENPIKKGFTISTEEMIPKSFDQEETSAIKDRLKGLGYID
ncbi:MAG: alkaline phosphatase family protein [Thermodesulfovibrionales bacterium]